MTAYDSQIIDDSTRLLLNKTDYKFQWQFWFLILQQLVVEYLEQEEAEEAGTITNYSITFEQVHGYWTNSDGHFGKHGRVEPKVLLPCCIIL